MAGMGHITTDMIGDHVRDQVVWDLGAGPHLGWCSSLLEWGASQVVAVEKESIRVTPRSGVVVKNIYFSEVVVPAEGIDVAFLSWPSNRRLQGLIHILVKCRKIIYQGCNYNGCACGEPYLYTYLKGRKVEALVTTSSNTFTVYGEPCSPREPTHEEWCGITGIDKPPP